jgi:hypothetical protein
LSTCLVNPKTTTIKHNGKNLKYLYREIDDLIGWFISNQFPTERVLNMTILTLLWVVIMAREVFAPASLEDVPKKLLYSWLIQLSVKRTVMMF